MVQINFALKEVNCKIVFYGPGKSGKTTNLEMVHKNAPAGARGELTSIATEGDRTLFFDFMPLDLGTIAGMKTKFQLYTVPGQVYYNSTRKLVLQGCDGVLFVADSSRAKLDENKESLANLRENLAEYGKKLEEIPFVIQWNKRDAADAMPVEELEAELNPLKVPTFEASWRITSDTGELPRDEWTWQLRMMLPDFVDEEAVEKAKREVARRKPDLDTSGLRFERGAQGLCVQIMHLGPYDTEDVSIFKMLDYMGSEHLQTFGPHHEVYLNDPNRCKPESIKTILRQRVVRPKD